MRQRNDTGYGQHVRPSAKYADRAPFDVGAGEEVDFPELLGGFTQLEDEPPVKEEPPKPRRKDAAAAADKEAGEPQ